MGIYGIKRNTAEKQKLIKEWTKSGLIVSSISSVGSCLGNLLKIIPIIGQIPGGLIDETSSDIN